MQRFFKRIMRPIGITPPPVCQKAFLENFAGAINVEWSEKGDRYEAAFYRDNLEHLANFTNNGRLIDYRMSLTAEMLPAIIRTQLEGMGEIMNCILINRGNSLIYESIVRDKHLDRYEIEMSGLAKKITSKKL